MEDNGVPVEKSNGSLLVVGLGNPGYEYVSTRHNAGFLVVDTLMQGAEFVEKTSWQPPEGQLFRVVLKDGTDSAGKEILVLKPQTYMNLSGLAVVPVLEWSALTPCDLLVVSDDLDMSLGRLRLRMKGSSGGHRGLASIAECLGTEIFPRLRLGVGRPQPGDAGVRDYVLGDWASDEQALLERVVDEAVSRIRKFADGGKEGFSVTVKEDLSDKDNAASEGETEIEKV